MVFTLPAPISDIAYQNKATIYDILFKAAAETLTTIAADPKHLGARIGLTSVLHTWGSALTHHPHVHIIVPGGGISLDGERWVACRPGFFLPVRVLSRLFRRLFLERLTAAHQAGALKFFGTHAPLAARKAFAAFLAPSPHHPSLSQLTSQPETIPSCHPENAPHQIPTTFRTAPREQSGGHSSTCRRAIEAKVYNEATSAHGELPFSWMERAGAGSGDERAHRPRRGVRLAFSKIHRQPRWIRRERQAMSGGSWNAADFQRNTNAT
jgi:hypothetical protein